MSDAPAPSPLFLVRGEATDEEVAALAVVLQSVAATASTAGAAQRGPRSAWSDPAHAVRRPLAAGPGAWRSSALPR